MPHESFHGGLRLLDDGGGRVLDIPASGELGVLYETFGDGSPAAVLSHGPADAVRERHFARIAVLERMASGTGAPWVAPVFAAMGLDPLAAASEAARRTKTLRVAVRDLGPAALDEINTTLGTVGRVEGLRAALEGLGVPVDAVPQPRGAAAASDRAEASPGP